MLIINKISEMRAFITKHKNKTIGFVPTMGYLHEGHLSLIKKARQVSDIVIVSIFINPLQFSVNEDLGNYPKDLIRDTALCENALADVLFAPDAFEMYQNCYPPYTMVTIATLGQHLCGAKRSGHFNGVCTVVSKLFNIITPDKAFFGRKDIQQLRIIETMVAELNFHVEIIGCTTVRASDGLALSSRNSYLSATERNAAIIVPKLLQHIIRLIKAGKTQTDELLKEADSYIRQCETARLDYLQIVDYDKLQPVNIISGTVIIATAIFIGKTRLIDNIIYDSEKSLQC